MGRGYFFLRGGGRGALVISQILNFFFFFTLKYVILFGFQAAMAVAVAIVLRIYVFDGLYQQTFQSGSNTGDNDHFYKAKKINLTLAFKTPTIKV